MKKFGPWWIKATQQVYRDPYVTLTRDDVVRPDGKDGTHVKVFMKPGVSVLPMDDDGAVYLTREFHYAVGRDSVEVVSGGIEPDEEPLSTARRELEEELGIRAEHFEDLGTVDPFTTIIESPTRLYLATGLSFVHARPDGTEQIECVQLAFEDALAQVMNGEISHGPSCIAILKTAVKRQSSNKIHFNPKNGN